MSNDVVARLDVTQKSTTLASLLETLRSERGAFSDLVERYGNAWRPKQWVIDSLSPGSGPALLGPGGFVIQLGPRVADLYHMMRFSTFVVDARWRRTLREALARVAELCGSTRAIVTHEMMPLDGNSLEESERGLRDRIGPPAADFVELEAAEEFGPRAWYLDTFSDLRSP